MEVAKTMCGFFNLTIPHFKIEQDTTPESFAKSWVDFCNEHNYDLRTYRPKMGWLNEDFENFKITVIAERI